MKKPEQKSKTSNNKTEELKIDSYKVTRAKMWDNGGVTFDMILNGIHIYGANVVEGKNGDFISLPQRKGSDGKYYSIVYARFSEKDQKDILQEVENKLNE